MLRFITVLPSEDSLLYDVYVLTRQDEFDHLGLPTQQIDALLSMQYKAQKSSYQRQFPQAKYELVYYEDVPIGRMITDEKSQGIHLVDIAFIPEYRGKGYGTQLIKSLQNFATEKQLPVTLNVLQGNPAKRLYERCGFYVTGEVSPYVSMKWEKK